MSIESSRLIVAGIPVEVVRKDIKNLHLGVYPPHGRVRVAAPLVITDEAVRLAVIDKLGWIRQQRRQFQSQPRQSRREMVNGESHYYLGQRYRLTVLERAAPPRITLQGLATLELQVRPGTTAGRREALLQRWYRDQLRSVLPPLLDAWQKTLEVGLAGWGIRRMKTKWGSCNAEARRVWFNLELAKKPPQCLEYIVVHELIHLRVRRHDAEFMALLDRHLPTWRSLKALLGQEPLGHEAWTC
jgi:hypothetical protein